MLPIIAPPMAKPVVIDLAEREQRLQEQRLRAITRVWENAILPFWIVGASVGLATCSLAQAAIYLSR